MLEAWLDNFVLLPDEADGTSMASSRQFLHLLGSRRSVQRHKAESNIEAISATPDQNLLAVAQRPFCDPARVTHGAVQPNPIGPAEPNCATAQIPTVRPHSQLCHCTRLALWSRSDAARLPPDSRSLIQISSMLGSSKYGCNGPNPADGFPIRRSRILVTVCDISWSPPDEAESSSSSATKSAISASTT
jgi:hypothetical protein